MRPPLDGSGALSDRLRRALAGKSRVRILADALISERSLTKMLAGHTTFRPATLYSLAEALNVSPEWLKHGTGASAADLDEARRPDYQRQIRPKPTQDTADRLFGLIFDLHNLASAKVATTLPAAYRGGASSMLSIALARLAEAEFDIRIEPGAEGRWTTVLDMIEDIEQRISRTKRDGGR